MRADTCAACGSTINLQYHHLIPRSLGGSDDETNLITLCGECHAKAHGIQADWRHSELTRRGLATKKARGERVGSIPYGFRDEGGQLVPNEIEQDILRLSLQWRSQGDSLRTIAEKLTERGFKSRGQSWNPQTIKNIVVAASLHTGNSHA